MYRFIDYDRGFFGAITHGAAKSGYTTLMTTTPERMARAMNPEERRVLLARIRKSLSVQDDERRKIIHAEMRQDHRRELVRADLETLGMWERFLLWLRRIFSHRSREDLFIHVRLEQMSKEILASSPVIYDPVKREVLPAAGVAVAQLFRRSEAVRPFFNHLWHHEGMLRDTIAYLLSRRIPNAKRDVREFVSQTELEGLFLRTESFNGLKSEVLEQLGSYIDQIPQSVLDEIEQGLHPLYLYREVILFPYHDMFPLFRSSREDVMQDEPSKIRFQAVAAARIIDSLEQLYLGLYHTTKSGESPELMREVFTYVIAGQSGMLDDTGLPILDDEAEVLALERKFQEMTASVTYMRDTLPLAQTIRVIRGDPYYRFFAYTPRLRLREFYYSHLKVQLLDQLEEAFNEIRFGSLQQLVQKVFPEGIHDLEFFGAEVQESVDKAGAGTLRIYPALQVIQTFLIEIYQNGLYDFLHVLGKLFPMSNRQSPADLTLYLTGFDAITERLYQFDQACSSNTDEGKAFELFRFTTVEAQKERIEAFRAMVAHKERTAHEIIEKFQETLEGVLSGLSLVQSGQVAEAGAKVDPAVTRGLKGYRGVVHTTLRIIRQLRALEKEHGYTPGAVFVGPGS